MALEVADHAVKLDAGVPLLEHLAGFTNDRLADVERNVTAQGPFLDRRVEEGAGLG